MEAIWNYFYWQTLSTNALDDIGHVLRLGIVVNECIGYTTEAEKQALDKCNQFLGPTQPGVTTPDPTEGSTPSAAGTPAAATAAPAPAQSGGAGLLNYLLAP
jgi:hypothetical protein